MSIYDSDIVFSKPFVITSDIVFAPDVPAINATIFAVVPKPTVSVQLSTVHNAQLAGTVPKPTVSVQLSRVLAVTVAAQIPKPLTTCFIQYDNNVWRGVQSIVDTSHNEAESLDTKGVETSWSDTTPLNKAMDTSWKETSALSNSVLMLTDQATPLDTLHRTKYSEAVGLDTSKPSAFSQTVKIDQYNATRWNEALSIDASVSSSNDQCAPLDTSRASKWSVSTPSNTSWITTCSVSKPLDKALRAVYDEAMRTPGAFWYRDLVVLPPGPPDIRSTDIVFGDVLFSITSDIVFGIKIPSNKIISKRFYYMLNTFYLRRVSDSAEIQINRIDATLSQTDYTWGFTFTVTGTNSYNKLVEYDPMELELMVNRMEVEDTANRH